MNCPFCGAKADAHFVDIGVGMQQTTPYECGACFARQIGPHDSVDPALLSPEERKFWWYAPPK